MKSKTLIISIIAIVLITASITYAAKREFAVRANLDNLNQTRQDQPFEQIAVVTGRCRDVIADLKKSSRIIWLYRQEKDNSDFKTREIGAFYINGDGVRSVCLDELAIQSFVEKNIHGERVEITGVLTSGKSYGLEREEIVLVDKMELKKLIINP